MGDAPRSGYNLLLRFNSFYICPSSFDIKNALNELKKLNVIDKTIIDEAFRELEISENYDDWNSECLDT